MAISATKPRERKLLDIATSQSGYFTAKQARKAGYSYRLQHYHKAQGHWDEVERGVFRYSDYPATEHEDLIRWALWSRNREDIPQAVISHETALSIHELGDVMPGKVHLTVSEGFRKTPPGGCILHKDFLMPEETENREGFTVTTPLRTLKDVAGGALSIDHLEKAMRDAISRGLITMQDIQKQTFSKPAKDKIRIVLEEIKKHPRL